MRQGVGLDEVLSAGQQLHKKLPSRDAVTGGADPSLYGGVESRARNSYFV
jgi:hypothetical protein